MSGNRVEKFERQMQRELGEIFQQRSRDWFGGAFITVSGVKASPDLGYLKIYISLFNVATRAETLANVELHNKQIRKDLSGRIGKTVRIIPELTFFEDDTLDYVNKFDAIFDDLRKERESRENNNES
ncbi:MAG: 30S ribosome-binding factor RbfA [Bacteroidia bacterium]|nr:30S ribosome-binding factor RbfA [Bacteroidia bacterium]